MQKTVTQEQIQIAADKIAKEFKPEKIILFGSYAWGNPGPDSDVDLFIVTETENRRETAVNISKQLLPRPFPMDLLVYEPEMIRESIKKGNFFVRDIMNNGKVLYAR